MVSNNLSRSYEAKQEALSIDNRLFNKLSYKQGCSYLHFVYKDKHHAQSCAFSSLICEQKEVKD